MDLNHLVATKYESNEHINDLKLLLLVLNWNINFMKRSHNLISCAITFKIETVTHNNNDNRRRQHSAFTTNAKSQNFHMQNK